jgi:hypothetical protein
MVALGVLGVLGVFAFVHGDQSHDDWLQGFHRELIIALAVWLAGRAVHANVASNLNWMVGKTNALDRLPILPLLH